VRGPSRGRATAELVAKCELLIRCYWLSAELRLTEFRAGFRLAPAAGDQPKTGAGAGSAAAGEGSADRGGSLGPVGGGAGMAPCCAQCNWRVQWVLWSHCLRMCKCS
jgi:hypothetical protein